MTQLINKVMLVDSTAYNLAYGFRLRGPLEPELLRRALALLVERQPAAARGSGRQAGSDAISAQPEQCVR